MLKPFLLLLLSALLSAGVNAQADSIRKYLDVNLNFTSKKNMVYPAMALRNGDRWVLFAVYPDTSVLLKIFFKDRALTVRDGPYTLYYPKKKLWMQGSFENNKANGVWQTWYMNQQIKDSGTRVDNYLSGKYKQWFENGQLAGERNYLYADKAIQAALEAKRLAYYSLMSERLSNGDGDAGVLPSLTGGSSGLLGILQGPAATWYPNGNKESAVQYENDTLSGVCNWYYENGQPSSREKYENGKVTELACFDETGRYTGATCSILKLPVLVHPLFAALDYIEYELHKTKLKDIKQEGEVKVSFTITREGKLEKLVIKQSPDPALRLHVAAIFAAMPAWSPAVVHNRKIDYEMEMTIPFYHEFD